MWLFTSFGYFSIVRKTDGPLHRHYLPQASEPEARTGTGYP
jgi:hypothetical protein